MSPLPSTPSRRAAAGACAACGWWRCGLPPSSLMIFGGRGHRGPWGSSPARVVHPRRRRLLPPNPAASRSDLVAARWERATVHGGAAAATTAMADSNITDGYCGWCGSTAAAATGVVVQGGAGGAVAGVDSGWPWWVVVVAGRGISCGWSWSAGCGHGWAVAGRLAVVVAGCGRWDVAACG